MKEKQSKLMVLRVNSAKSPILPDLMYGLGAIPIQIPASYFVAGPTYSKVYKKRLKKTKRQYSAQEEKCWRTHNA